MKVIELVLVLEGAEKLLELRKEGLEQEEELVSSYSLTVDFSPRLEHGLMHFLLCGKHLVDFSRA